MAAAARWRQFQSLGFYSFPTPSRLQKEMRQFSDDSVTSIPPTVKTANNKRSILLALAVAIASSPLSQAVVVVQQSRVGVMLVVVVLVLRRADGLHGLGVVQGGQRGRPRRRRQSGRRGGGGGAAELRLVGGGGRRHGHHAGLEGRHRGLHIRPEQVGVARHGRLLENTQVLNYCI